MRVEDTGRMGIKGELVYINEILCLILPDTSRHKELVCRKKEIESILEDLADWEWLDSVTDAS